ncbi:hypothetical protein [Chryseobacterium limigenitum]|nr:hypothetical protein [Chryseobacterium limigenitum]
MNNYLDNGMVSFGIFLLISFLLILVNKMLFQFQSQHQGKLVVILTYIIFYLVLSYVAVVQLMTFYYLQPEINTINNSESSISMFSAMIQVIGHLELEQKKSLQQFQSICFIIPFVLSQTLLLINYMILRNRTMSHPEFQLEQIRLEIQQAIQKKQKEYVQLFQNPTSTDELFEEGNSEEQRSETAQRLLQEIASLKSGLQYLD